MNSPYSLTNDNNLQQQAYQYLIQGNYSKAASFYEQAIEAEPLVKSHYWNLGLTLLLQGQEEEAQTTWLLGMAGIESEQIDLETKSLVQVLQSETERREELADYQMAWTIRQHIREIAPDDINNLLHSVRLAIKLETLTDEYLATSNIVELLKSNYSSIAPDVLLQILPELLNYPHIATTKIEFAEACLEYTNEPQFFIHVLILAAINICYSARQPRLAAQLAEIILRLEPNNPEILIQLTSFYHQGNEFIKSLEIAKQLNAEVKTLAYKVYANHLLLKSLMAASGYWQEACSVLQEQKLLLQSLLEEWPTNLEGAFTLRLFCSTFFLPYFQDDPHSIRPIQNQIARLGLDNVQNYAKDYVNKYRHSASNQKNNNTSRKILRVGYLSHCLRRHSVGWIARWLFEYHDPERFQIYAYLINPVRSDNDLQQWFIDRSYQAYGFEVTGNEKAIQQIQKDEIDILVDLDSLTLDNTCEILAIKPAPVQVTWLGWDASGLPTIDYFIADPYVLPDSAQDYYTEKIWRLPQTYVAVDGFEVGVPTLRRDRLDIPSDAVVYFVGQRGYKRNLDNIRLQMKIIKEVPNSYFLIKGEADEKSTRSLYEQIAETEGVACSRLRFLPEVGAEAVHRANLGVADVVLDTYPYNGATTTLETLWMCIPLVTRVGQQFAARNSYTMMINAGVTEGIAWTDEEYVEWGVRLGKDAALRQQIAWKLRQSRQTAPLWNGKQFTREMEKAYEQMWKRYVEH